MPSPWACPTSDTQGKAQAGLLPTGPWSRWAWGPGRLPSWAIRSLPIFWAGKRAGVRTLLVEPIRLAGNPGPLSAHGGGWPLPRPGQTKGANSMSVSFGPAGEIPDSLLPGAQVLSGGPGWIRAFGLDAYEYQCGKGVSVGRRPPASWGERPEGGHPPLPPRPLH